MVSRAIVLREKQWAEVYNRLATEHPSSYLLIRSVMKRELGFTVRRHRRWISAVEAGTGGSGYFRNEIHLDFYNEAAKTFFTLKYLHNNTD